MLRAKLFMVRYDPRGHGLTDKPIDPDSYASVRYAEDVEAIVKAYDLKQPFFAGWSLAAAIAVDIAAHWPSPLPFSGFISFAGRSTL
jgi:pimeloyl-ACP methyl ester carboxylesterase